MQVILRFMLLHECLYFPLKLSLSDAVLAPSYRINLHQISVFWQQLQNVQHAKESSTLKIFAQKPSIG